MQWTVGSWKVESHKIYEMVKNGTATIILDCKRTDDTNGAVRLTTKTKKELVNYVDFKSVVRAQEIDYAYYESENDNIAAYATGFTIHISGASINTSGKDDPSIVPVGSGIRFKPVRTEHYGSFTETQNGSVLTLYPMRNDGGVYMHLQPIIVELKEKSDYDLAHISVEHTLGLALNNSGYFILPPTLESHANKTYLSEV